MKTKYTKEQLADDFKLWGEYFDTGAERMLMNPATGSVDTAENWADEGFGEEDGLMEVVANVEGHNSYDIQYGAWRPAA